MSTSFSPARLATLGEHLAGYVERGQVPGLVAAVERRGELHVEVLGVQALGGPPMRRDTLFRISSMTKPVAAVAALILVEECRLRLDEPIDRLLPELAGRRVLRRIDGPLDDTEPAQRPITLRDLLTFRAGWGILLSAPDSWPIQRAIAELGIAGFGPPNPAAPHDADEWLRRLATLPLLHQPGERWFYNTASLVLGVLIARAAERPLEDFLRERIFAPLGMRDTGFDVPPASRGRFATGYAADADGALVLLDDPATSAWNVPPAFPDPGAGLVSTLDDYLAFARMLLAGGTLGGVRMLSRAAVELMTSDQLTPEQRATAGPILGDDRGWGLGVAIARERADIATTPGRYGWDGGLGTFWTNHPREELTTLLLTQRAMWPPLPLEHDFRTLAVAALV